ncbi:Cytochrome c oxidase assembly protein PET191, partial [Trinorchestia longiramus]
MTSNPVMLRYTDETQVLDSSTMEACSGVRADLKHCLLSTDCCIKERKTPKQCLSENHASIPQDCYALLNTFFECKRSLV